MDELGSSKTSSTAVKIWLKYCGQRISYDSIGTHDVLRKSNLYKTQKQENHSAKQMIKSCLEISPHQIFLQQSITMKEGLNQKRIETYL